MNMAMRQSVRSMYRSEERTARARRVSRPYQMSASLEYEMTPSNAGFLLLDGFQRPIYASPVAIEILLYPEGPKGIQSFNGHLSAKIQSLLIRKPSSPKAGFVNEFMSGRRRYSCRAFTLNAGSNHLGKASTIALLLERSRNLPPETLLWPSRLTLQNESARQSRISSMV